MTYASDVEEFKIYDTRTLSMMLDEDSGYFCVYDIPVYTVNDKALIPGQIYHYEADDATDPKAISEAEGEKIVQGLTTTNKKDMNVWYDYMKLVIELRKGLLN